MLVGTALAVIIPEGVRSLTLLDHHAEAVVSVSPETNKQHGSDPFSAIGITLVLGFVFMLVVDQVLFLQVFLEMGFVMVFYRYHKVATVTV